MKEKKRPTGNVVFKFSTARIQPVNTSEPRSLNCASWKLNLQYLTVNTSELKTQFTKYYAENIHDSNSVALGHSVNIYDAILV